MSNNRLLLDIFDSYLERYRQQNISYSQLVPFLERYQLEHPEHSQEISGLMRNNLNNLGAAFEELEDARLIQILRNDSSPLAIIYPGFYIKRIEQYYSRMEDQSELPFPQEAAMGIFMPDSVLTVVDIRSDFVQWLTKDETQENRILKINFPDGITSLVCTSHILANKVLLGSVHKLRHYLRDQKNFAYTRQKLTPVLKGRELAVKELLHSIVTTPEAATNTIREPSDFSFHLWTQFSSNIIKEYSTKVDKLAEEHAYCQAAYLIGYYNVFHRGTIQRRRDEETAINQLFLALKKPPYAFRISDIHEFKDDKGILLTKKLDKERINEVVKERLLSKDKKELPMLLRLIPPDNEQYFILYSAIPQMVSEQVLRAQREMREFYKNSWAIALKQDMEFTTMLDGKAFLDHISLRLSTHYPVLQSVLNYRTLLLASRCEPAPEAYRREIETLLDNGIQALLPLDRIFGLDRKRLHDDVKMLLPSWMVIPVVRGIVRFLRMMFLGPTMANRPYMEVFDHEGQIVVKKKGQKEADAKAGEADASARSTTKTVKTSDAKNNRQADLKQQANRFHDAARGLESEFLPPGSNLEDILHQLEDRWNTLLDPGSKQHLTQDIQNLCRDYLKKMRITSKSKLPDAESIKAYAIKVWETETLVRIRNRKDLLRYLELYILQLLETMP